MQRIWGLISVWLERTWSSTTQLSLYLMRVAVKGAVRLLARAWRMQSVRSEELEGLMYRLQWCQ